MIQNIRYSLSYYHNYWKVQLLILFILISKNLVSLVTPFIYAQIINSMVNRELISFSGKFIILVSLQFLTLILGYASNRIGIYLSREVNISVKEKMVKQLLTIPPYKLDYYSTGKIQVLLSTDTVVPSTFITTIISAFMTLCTIIGTAIAIFLVNWVLACILLCTYPFTITVNRYYTKKLKSSALQLAKDNDSFISCTRQIAGNLTDVKVQNGRKVISDSYCKAAERNKEAVSQHLKLTANNSLSISVINFINYILVTAIGIIFVMNGYMPIGFLVAFHSYSKNFSAALDGIVQLKSQIQPLLVSIGRLMEVDKIYEAFIGEEKNRSCLRKKIESIELEEVSLSFGEKEILKRFSYAFSCGITGISGANGCGKTTLLELLLKNYIPQKGSVKIGGVFSENVSYTDIQRKMSYVGTGKVLYNLTIRENLLLFEGSENVSEDSVLDALKTVNLYDDIVNLPEGLETQISDDFRLSSGQIQKLQIARAFLRNSDVFLFDEAFTNLDIETKRNVFEYIEEQYTDRIVVIVSHNEADYTICRKVLKM